MDLTPFVESLRQELATAAEVGGDEARDMADRLSAVLEPAVRLALLEALSSAAGEITQDLAPGSVELRLRGRDPGFVVTHPDLEPRDDATPTPPTPPVPVPGADDDTTTVRLNVRLGGQLKARIEQAATRAGLSLNAWLASAAVSALENEESGRRGARRAARGSERFTGWVR